MSELFPIRLQPPLFPGTLKKLTKGKTLNTKSKSGNTGFDDVMQDGGMANGRDVEDQRIDLSTKSVIIGPTHKINVLGRNFIANCYVSP